ncbi:MAG TPA: DUF3109 family protein [Candidatus Hydrogenedentes bacterium]|jgi:hypothetical protein|nr:DUF3109 family protein [Candidatus Hydrogenedentota bacterium]MDY0032350.1 DUF3109 family protein [FCB group bacterium]NLT61950.1 DUF3109 family protein [Candidatus Hydrogenedentota bacterium]HNV21093.1 DUF3109 family protein [Candidatus Hydrogenedentota bacterium]HNZ18493.1 DUF3109 family protein [Candidatus Hydrogenedentota bacterium]
MEEGFPVIGGYRIDLNALTSIAHRCDPGQCDNGLSCCSCYDVELSPMEARRVVDWLPEAAKFARKLHDKGGFVDPVERMPGSRPTLAVDAAERCVFAYKAPSGGLWCALHSAALAHGLAPETVKPLSCALWPLAISDEEEPPILTVQPEAARFTCNSARVGDGLDAGIADIIERCFGPRFRRDLEACLARK